MSHGWPRRHAIWFFVILGACTADRVSCRSKNSKMIRPREGPNVVLDEGASGGGREIFPLSISSDKSHLVDAKGQPFLLIGDTAWSLPTSLSKPETIEYLEDRKSRGFNTIVIEMMEHKFTAHSPAWRNANGEVPFDDNSDMTTTRAAFFDHVAWVIQEAANRGVLVLVTPAYIGYDCGDEGWCSEMFASGVSKLTEYGRFVGQRFRDLPNIIWVEGGDLTRSTSGNPSQLDLVNAVANGVRAGDGGAHLHTAHWSRGKSSSEGPAVSWLDLDATYSGRKLQTYQDSLGDWGRSGGKRPIVFLEGHYESASSTGADLRAQMYQPLLCGATGFVFGNHPIWFLGRPGDGNPGWEFSSDAPIAWTAALGSFGAAYATRARQLFAGLPWQMLRPDTARRFLTSRDAASDPNRNVVLAASEDGRLAVAYVSAILDFEINMAAFSGPVRATWYDPTSGTKTAAEEGILSNDRPHVFRPKSRNSEKASDWVLLLQVAQDGSG